MTEMVGLDESYLDGYMKALEDASIALKQTFNGSGNTISVPLAVQILKDLKPV